VAVDPAPLESYRQKRDFSRTPEPAGSGPEEAPTGSGYLIQKHDASRLHYDLRLELDGVLLSWAVPKGPSLRPGAQRLAMRTEDHPLEYGTFEGTIPKGEYGGGTVLLWDRGTWTPVGDPREGLAQGKLTFELHGERLRGGWHLVRTRGEGKGEPWLLMKRRDRFADDDGDAAVREQLTSVATGRTMDEIARATGDEAAVWRSDRARTSGPGATPEIEGAVRGPIPWPLEPQRPQPVDAPPTGAGWVHELKHDGYRVLVRLTGGRASIVTRGGQDWTDRLRPIARAFEALGPADAVLDGELVSLDPQGRSSFSALQRSLSASPGSLHVYVFDLLSLGDLDLRGAPLLARKEVLATLLHDGAGQGQIRYGDHVDAEGATVLTQACALGAEGIVSKQVDAPYRSGRHTSWRKVKCLGRSELLVCGWSSRNQDLSALLLADPDSEPLRYAGKVGTGFTEADRAALLQELQPLRIEAPAVRDPPRAPRGDELHWVRPEVLVEVRYAGWTEDGRLRHPSFEGLRLDKRAEASREGAPPKASREGAPPKASREGAPPQAPAPLPAVRVSSAGRVVYPALGITKGEVAAWAVHMAPAMLPGVVDRPLSLVRCPTGVDNPCFFQKHRENLPDSVLPVEVPGQDQPYVQIRDAEGLLALFQHGVLEVHPWGARSDRPDRPDRLVMDLDPDEGLPFAAVVRAAVSLRERLEALGLHSFVRTTGGKGLHVVVPIERRTSWADAKAFTRGLAEAMVAHEPAAYTAVMRKAKRRGKIYVDYLRNGEGSTAIASWSPRARPGATVAVPLRWEDLRDDLDPAAFTLRTVRLPPRDPWTGFDEVRQRITAAMVRELAG
jgi:bifunctional non-homologous end joining protein LigD